jgi:hypothetical protein
MLFRYKIEKGSEYICNGIILTHYYTKIQRYYENNMLFKWVTCENTTLKSIVELLGKDYCFTNWDNALQEIAQTINQYGSVDQMIAEYIHKFIMKDIEHTNMMNDIEKSVDELVLTNEWKTIEFKENK